MCVFYQHFDGKKYIKNLCMIEKALYHFVLMVIPKNEQKCKRKNASCFTRVQYFLPFCHGNLDTEHYE